MKRKHRARRVEIIKALSDLSRNGWAGVRPEDYKPLEDELRAMDQEAAQK